MNTRPTAEQLKSLYLRWLKGESLRQLARATDIRFQTLHTWFIKSFGVKACCPIANSLVRSVLADYPDLPEARLWAYSQALHGETEVIQHRSQHNIKQLSRFQYFTDDTMQDILTADQNSSDPWDSLDEPSLDFIRLELYHLVVTRLVYTLYETLFILMAEQLRLEQEQQTA